MPPPSSAIAPPAAARRASPPARAQHTRAAAPAYGGASGEEVAVGGADDLAGGALAGFPRVAAHDRNGDGGRLRHHEAGGGDDLVGGARRADPQLAAVEVALAGVVKAALLAAVREPATASSAPAAAWRPARSSACLPASRASDATRSSPRTPGDIRASDSTHHAVSTTGAGPAESRIRLATANVYVRFLVHALVSSTAPFFAASSKSSSHIPLVALVKDILAALAMNKAPAVYAESTSSNIA